MKAGRDFCVNRREHSAHRTMCHPEAAQESAVEWISEGATKRPRRFVHAELFRGARKCYIHARKSLCGHVCQNRFLRFWRFTPLAFVGSVGMTQRIRVRTYQINQHSCAAREEYCFLVGGDLARPVPHCKNLPFSTRMMWSICVSICSQVVMITCLPSILQSR